MRSSILVASFMALAAALPTIAPVETTSLAIRDEPALDFTATLETRQTTIPYDRKFTWPDTQVTAGGLSAQFRATNLNNGNYSFQLWNSASANAPPIHHRIFYGGNTLVELQLSVGQTTTGTIPKTGDNFNVYIWIP